MNLTSCKHNFANWLGKEELVVAEVFGAVVLFACLERLTKDRWPAGPPTANIDRFARYLSLRVVLEAPPEAYGPRLFSLGAGHDRLVVRQT